MYNFIKEKEVYMVLAIIVLFMLLAFAVLFKFLPLKFTSVILCVAALVLSAGLCLIQPKMHKPFSISIVEYFIQVDDGGASAENAE